MDRVKRNLVFYFVLALDFYILPLLIRNTGSAMIFMLIIIPVVCFITSVIYGFKNEFNFWYAPIAAVIFIPTIFLFYNSSAWFYAVIYGVISLIGNLSALPFRKK